MVLGIAKILIRVIFRRQKVSISWERPWWQTEEDPDSQGSEGGHQDSICEPCLYVHGGLLPPAGRGADQALPNQHGHKSGHCHWMSLFLCSLTDSGVYIWVCMKYVDYVNIVIDIVDPRWRWVQGCQQWNEDWKEQNEQSGVLAETRTMGLVQETAKSIFEWLHFTVDLPSFHEQSKVPMLYLQVWVDRWTDHEDQDPCPDILIWSFYKKPSSSVRVLKASSAYGWRSKLICMNIKVFTRHINMSRQVSLQKRVEIMERFMRKLRLSGYCTRTVDRILEEGSWFYYCHLRVDLEGGPPLNLRSKKDLVNSHGEKD